MKRRRERDVIDVNREWNVHSGTRVNGRWIGTIFGHDFRTALDAARNAWPGIRLWIEDKAEDDARIERQVAAALARNGRMAQTHRSNHHG